MSFHGGLIGSVLAGVLFARSRGVRVLLLSDLVMATAPLGLFFGRVGNFINAELYGRPSDLPGAMVFQDTSPGVHEQPGPGGRGRFYLGWKPVIIFASAFSPAALLLSPSPCGKRTAGEAPVQMSVLFFASKMSRTIEPSSKS